MQKMGFWNPERPLPSHVLNLEVIFTQDKSFLGFGSKEEHLKKNKEPENGKLSPRALEKWMEESA